MNKKMLCGLITGIFLITLSSGCSTNKVANSTPVTQQQETQQQKNAALNPELYTVGNGKIGLFHKNLTLDETKKIITTTYGGRFSEAQEAAGEGTTARVITAYLNKVNPDEVSIKITLDKDGKIYRIVALSPKFKTPKGLHPGSTWSDIRSVYPQAKITVENIIAFIALDDKVTCELKTSAKPDWQKIKTGQENPPEDLKIISLHAY